MNKIDGRYLKKLREERGLSLRAFADKIYASKSSVQRWEKSAVPNDEELLEKIADAFGLSVAEMQRQSEEKFGKDALSPEQLAELKFGVKKLIIPLICIFAAVAAAIVLIAVL